MTLANGSAILASDVIAAIGASRSTARADNAAKPLAHVQNFTLTGVVASTPYYARKAVFVAPFDALLEVVAINTFGFTAASTTTVNLKALVTTSTGQVDSSVVMFPVKVPVGTDTAVVRPARVLYQGGRGRADPVNIVTNPAVRTLLGGATYVLDFETTSVATTSVMQVALGLRAYWGRGA